MAHPLLRSTIDAAAAATLAAAVWFALTSLFALQPLVATCVGVIVFIRVFASLVRLPPLPTQLSFLPAPLQFEQEVEELLLNEPVEAAAGTSRVARIFGGAMPTPGEMQAAIERHLRAQPQAAPDATEELREALAQLRRAAR